MVSFALALKIPSWVAQCLWWFAR